MTISRSVFLSLLLIGLLSSCGDDEIDCTDQATNQSTLDASAAGVSAAIDAFNADQSDDNCNNLVDAYEDQIEDLESFQVCADQTGQGQQFRDAVTQARDAIASLPCG
jgi:hypothetical protein